MSKEKVKTDIEKLKAIYDAQTYAELARNLNITRAAIDSWIRTENIPKKYLIIIEDNSDTKVEDERKILIESIKKNIDILNDIDLYKTLIFTSEKIRDYYKKQKGEK